MSTPPVPLHRALAPSLGIAASFTLLHLGMVLAELVAAVVTAGVAFLVLPRHVFSGGMDMMSTSDADYTRWDHIRPFLPGALGFLSGSVLADLPTPVVWPFHPCRSRGDPVVLRRGGAACRSGRSAAARRALEQTY